MTAVVGLALAGLAYFVILAVVEHAAHGLQLAWEHRQWRRNLREIGERFVREQLVDWDPHRDVSRLDQLDGTR